MSVAALAVFRFHTLSVLPHAARLAHTARVAVLAQLGADHADDLFGARRSADGGTLGVLFVHRAVAR